MSIFALTLAGAGLSGCGNRGSDLADSPDFKAEKYANFIDGRSPAFTVSDARTNGGSFGCYWAESAISYDQNGMNFTLSKSNDTYYGAEQRTSNSYLYGYYGTTMKPIKGSGIISTFFTYTGSYENNAHNEIDIEFLGQDTSRVQFNYFTDDSKGHEYMYTLGFDASEDFHQYGFYWDDSQVVWYVDSKPVYRVKGAVPQVAQRVYQNVWCTNRDRASIVAWAGAVNDSDLPKVASYKDMTYADLDGKAADLSAFYQSIPDESTNKAASLTWTGNSLYTLASDSANSSVHITYSAIKPKTYNNIFATLDGDVAKSKNVFHILAKNNGTSLVKLRIDIRDTTSSASMKAINTQAYDGKGINVATDLTYGGSIFPLAGGESVDCYVEYKGIPDQILLMIDSMRGDQTSFAGDLDISHYYYCGQQTVTPDDAQKAYFLSWSGDSAYTISQNSSKSKVSYSNLSGGSFAHVYASFADSDIAKATGFGLAVSNKSTKEMSLRIDVTDGSKALNSSMSGSNISHLDNQGENGSNAVIAAGATAVLKVVYAGLAKGVNLFFDSAINGDTSTYSGKVSLSDYTGYFPHDAVLGEVVNPSLSSKSIPLSYETQDVYTLSGDSASTEVTYSAIHGATYKNIRAPLTSITTTNSYAFSLKIENKGSQALAFRADINAATTHGAHNITAINTAATAVDPDGKSVKTSTDLAWAGSNVSVPAGSYVIFTIKYSGTPVSIQFFMDSATYGDSATHEGDVVLSNYTLYYDADLSFDDSDDPVTQTVIAETPITSYSKKVVYPVSAWNSSVYTMSQTKDNFWNFAYTDLSASSWKNAQISLSSSVADVSDSSLNTLELTVRNNNGHVTPFRIDLKESASATTHLEKSMVSTGANISANVMKIEAYTTRTLRVTYSGVCGFICIFMDSCTSGDTSTNSGSVDISSSLTFYAVA
jgi:endo-1,3-1,4-beta-glycanase ExoK